MADQELSLKAKLDGGAETAQGIDKIAGAEEKLAGETSKAGQASGEAAKQVDKLKSSEGDVLGLLTQVSPALGAFADAMLKGSKVAGDLATEQINLGSVLQKTEGFIKANAGALKLLVAGGAIAAGIWAITKALEAEAKAHERVAEAAKRQRTALNELKGQREDMKQAIEEVSDVRAEGGMSAEQSRKATTTAGQIGGKFEQLKPDAIAQAVGMFGDKDLGLDKMIEAAILAQLGKLDVTPEMPESRRMAGLDRLTERHAGAIETFRSRETAQGQGLGDPRSPGAGPTEREQAAYRESRSAGGSTTELEAMLKQLLGPDADVERLAGLGQKYGGAEGLKEAEIGLASGQPVSVVLSRLLGEVRLDSPTGRGRDTAGEEIRGVDVVGREDFRALIEALRKLESRVQESTAVAKQSGGKGGTTVIHQNHARFTYPDGRSLRRATTNGETDRERRKLG